MVRRAKPIALHLAQGNPNHLTKAEIEHRKKSEIKIGDSKLTPPEFIKNDLIAYAKWKEIVKIFKNFDFVSSGDVGLIARYCKTYAEYLEAIERKKIFENNAEISLDDLIKLDSLINKKMDLLTKMEDRLFLNPLAKIKNVPKKEEEKEDPLVAKGFDNL